MTSPNQSVEIVLLSHGVKPTPQRMVIAEYLLNTCDHPTAEDVLAAVAGKLPVDLSRATVYNTISSLKDAGLVREVLLSPVKFAMTQTSSIIIILLIENPVAFSMCRSKSRAARKAFGQEIQSP